MNLSWFLSLIYSNVRNREFKLNEAIVKLPPLCKYIASTFKGAEGKFLEKQEKLNTAAPHCLNHFVQAEFTVP